MKIEIVQEKDGSSPCISIDGKNIIADNEIIIDDNGIVTVDGRIKVVIYGNATVFIKTGIASVS